MRKARGRDGLARVEAKSAPDRERVRLTVRRNPRPRGRDLGLEPESGRRGLVGVGHQVCARCAQFRPGVDRGGRVDRVDLCRDDPEDAALPVARPRRGSRREERHEHKEDHGGRASGHHGRHTPPTEKWEGRAEIDSAVMAQVLPAERDLRRVIGDADGAGDREVDGLGEQELLELYRSMVLLRTYDERSLVYHRQGRIGTYEIFWNHEAMQAGAAHALEDEDWIFPSYRESAIGLLRGMPASTVLSWWRGHPAGWWNPAGHNVASICVPIGTHVPHAAGLAWGKRLRGEKACAIAYFGDGATSEGAFHEGANFAAVMRAPLVLFCNNNQWAISTPLSAQTAAETLADKAAGYGMPSARVDGADVLAVYEATRGAVARARAGEGPTLIEAVTYRTAPHATADDQSAYIDLERVEEEKQRECLGRYEAYLRRQGLISDEAAEAVRAEAAELMRAGIAQAEAEPPPDPGLVFSHAYVEPPKSFEAELAELRRILDG